MNYFPKFDFSFDGLFRGPSRERGLLSVYIGDDISETEAQSLWKKIADHKWYVSERLSRDVGFHVAAIDYVENFYEPRARTSSFERFAALKDEALRLALRAIRWYFETKGKYLIVP